MKSKVCKNCQTNFEITPDDLLYYESIQVPPPTHCPQCRLQRRLAWLKGTQLYKRTCDLCHTLGLSMYAPDAPYTIYCHDCWWSDRWDPLKTGKSFDFSRPFFEQFNELFRTSPLRAQPIDGITRKLSPYTNHAGECKNCYLVFYTSDCEDSAYGFFLKHNKNSYDTSMTWECEHVYDITNGFKSYNVFTGQGNIISCIDCCFIKDCRNCTNCFGAVNQRNKSYLWFNEQLTKQEYEKRLREVDLGSHNEYEAMRTKANKLWQQNIPRPIYDDFTTNVTGNYVFQSKNCQECYEVGYGEDSKYLMLIKAGLVKNCYDYLDGWTAAERMYECVTVGVETSDVRFSQDGGHGLHSADYTILCFGGSNLFGCVGLRGKEYCILNKQYSKEEYHALREKIIAHMKTSGEYGEYFPLTMVPHAYNDTLAYLFFPKTEEQALKGGLRWLKPDVKEYTITMKQANIPDHIKDVNDDILQEVIQCSACVRGFKIIHQELQFLRQHNLPLPRQCPFCRVEAKVKRWVWQMTLGDRTCDNCGKTFRTHYRHQDAEHVFCKECYMDKIIR